MSLNVKSLLAEWQGRNYELHDAHVNPRFAKVLRTIGFDRCYVRASGAHLWDQHGTKHLDLTAGYGVFNVGRNNPDIARALTDFIALEYPSLVQLEAPLLSGVLAAELKKRTPPGLDYVYFTNSGTEGVETAIKCARCATGRPAIVYCHKAFHGLSTGSLSINGDETFRNGFSPFLPACRAIPFNDLAALESALSGRDVAAFIVEPIQGKGVNIPDPGYLAAAAELCRRHGTLFVADEVQTGIARTGRFLAIDHEPGLEPDLLVLSKALSGGYVPVGAVLMRKAVYDKVFSTLERAVVHSSTFGQNSLAMVAGLATLNVVDELDLCARAEQLGDRIGHGLEAMVPRYEFLRGVRWRGLMTAIEFGQPRSLSLRAAWSTVHAMDKSLFPQAVTMPLLQDHHILTQVAGHHMDVIKLLPPLVIDDADVDWFLSSFERVTQDLHQFPGPAWDVVTRIGRNVIGSGRAAPVQADAMQAVDAAPAHEIDAAPAHEAPDREASAPQATRAHVGPGGSWVHRLARHAVRPLLGTRVTPNHLTTLRLLSGLAAAAAFAGGDAGWIALGGVLFVLSAFIDRADGELARLAGLSSPGGHLYDLVADATVNALCFVAIGIGLASRTGSTWPLLAGLIAGVALAAIFTLVGMIEARTRDASPFSGGGPVDPDDVLFIIGPLAWIDALWPLLASAAVGAPLFAFWLLFRFRAPLFHGTPWRATPRAR